MKGFFQETKLEQEISFSIHRQASDQNARIRMYNELK